MMMSFNPFLLDFPDHFQTERLLIRAPQRQDAPAVNAAINESLAHLRPWVDWAQTPESLEDTEAHLRLLAARYQSKDDLSMLIFRQDGLFVGGCNLREPDWLLPTFRTESWVRGALLGQGYMTEALNGLARFAFEMIGAVRLEARLDARNTRAKALAERTGFRLEGRLRRAMRDPQGQLRDVLLYARLRG
jgi:RimJ/RimL family protein N-acetyltransferase